MDLRALIPALAAFLCLQVAVVFALIYFQVSRRRADLLFSAVALCLTWLAGSAYLFDQRADLASGLLWLRMQYAAGFATMTVFLHFASLVVELPLHPPALALTYLVGALLVALSFTPSFLHLPPAGTALDHMVPPSRGPLYNVLAPLLVVGPLLAWVRLIRGSRVRRQGGFAPLEHLTLILAGGLLIILAGAAIVAAVILLPELRIPVNIQSLAVVAFYGFTALALAKETLRSERERQRLAELAQFRHQAVRDLAHELKNPLIAIQNGMVTVLEAIRRGIDPQMQRELLEMSADTCRRLTRLINNMLDTARLEAGREPELRLEKTNLAELIEAVLAPQRLASHAHQLVTRVELADPIITVDPDKLHQILSNLVDNAVKYSPNGGEVVVRLWQVGDRVHISVSDQGIGMTPEQQANLFRPFERPVDPDRKITGTGIGLHLVRRLVEAHGGDIAVESVYGQGSAFTVSLPVQPAPKGQPHGADPGDRR